MRDWILERDSEVAKRRLSVALVPQQNVTKQPFYVVPMPVNGVVTGLRVYCSDYTAETLIDGLILAAGGSNGPIENPAWAINGTAQKFDLGAFAWRHGSAVFATGAQAALQFSAAHTIGGSKYGVSLVQIADDGTVSTKEPASNQTYTTAALAIAALPAPDAGNVAVGYILIAAAGGGFTMKTTALTGVATFHYTLTSSVAFATGLEPAAGASVEATISTTWGNVYAEIGSLLCLRQTGDGTADGADLTVGLDWRPYPLKGEAGR